VDLDADMMRDKAHDAFCVGGGDAAAGILKAARQPVDPKPPIWV
jgi:hypothetical protein